MDRRMSEEPWKLNLFRHFIFLSKLFVDSSIFSLNLSCQEERLFLYIVHFKKNKSFVARDAAGISVLARKVKDAPSSHQ